MKTERKIKIKRNDVEDLEVAGYPLYKHCFIQNVNTV